MFASMKIINKKAIVILPHLMEKNGALGKQTISRISHSVEIFKKGDYDFFITSGWDYRRDSKQKIGEVMTKYLIKNFRIDQKKILTDTYSRDTVGDAFFIREQFVIPMNILNLTVVTNDWHMNRTKTIFNKFFQKKVFIKLVGVSTSLKNNDQIVKKEKLSMDSFFKTFENVNLSDRNEVILTLRKKHPLYNGDKNEKILFP